MVWADQAAYQRPSPRASGYKQGFRGAGGGSLSAPALSRPSVSLPRLLASGLGERRVLVTTERVRKMQSIKKKVHFWGCKGKEAPGSPASATNDGDPPSISFWTC